ncbi:MAG: hypothetical protein J4G13_12770 [Dehalococcoidia bacterium]|nr:hypothetical protein [Dehalococcoidia bacterium]
MANAFRVTDWMLNQADPDGLRYVATVAVRLHWFYIAVLAFTVVYRPHYGVVIYAAYVVMLLLMAGFNLYTQYLLRSDRTITWRWILAVCTVDMFGVSIAAAISGGFSHSFLHLFYYQVLAGFAVVFTSFRLNMAWVTITSAIYVAISLGTGDGLDVSARDDKALVARIVVMYGLVATVNMISRFERMRWRETVEREQALVRERTELSQAIHDTTAQFAYMVGLGLETARAQSGDQNPELAVTLDATSELTKSMIWELRHPINMGGIYEGHELGRVLGSHASSFTNITSVPAVLTVRGDEPPLSVETRSQLFSIAHNALTNAYRHAQATEVCIDLCYDAEGIRLEVSDDGIGLPDDYDERGYGFASMSRDAERLGGGLKVEKKGRMGGATVACVVPSARFG